MKRLVLTMIAAPMLVWTAACGGGGGGASEPDASGDAFPDAGDVAGDALDVPDGDCTPVTLDWAVVTRTGEVGRGEEAVTLYPDDEPLAYVTFPALQFDVLAETACAGAGVPVTMTIEGQQVGQQAVVSAEGAAGEARFSSKTFPPSPQGAEVCVILTGPDGEAEVESCKMVRVLTETCDIAVVPEPADGCLREDVDPETPGLQTELTVRHEGGSCDRATITTEFGGVEETLGPVDFDEGGEATFTLSLGDDESPAQGILQITAAALHPSAPGLDAELAVAYTVDASAPVLSILQPSEEQAPLTLSMDANGDPSDGLQIDVRGEVSGLGANPEATVSLSLDGVQVAEVPHEAGIFVFEDVTFTQNGPVEIAVSAVDPCGNVGTDAVTLDVFAGEPAVDLIDPAAGTILGAVDDADPDTPAVFEGTFRIQADQVVEGTPVVVECRGADSGDAFVSVGSGSKGADPEEDVFVDVALDVDQLGHDVECRISVQGPNPVRSPVVLLTVGLPAPSLTLDAPETGARLGSKVVAVEGEAANLDGQPLVVRLFTSQGSVLCELEVDPIADGLFDQDVDLAAECAPLADDTYTLQVDGTDVFGNVASELGRADSAEITFDTVAPTLERLEPADDELDPVAVPAHEEAPQYADTPGYQTDVAYRLGEETVSDGAEVCVTVNGDALGCRAVDPATFVAAWPGVTLDPGTNSLEATGTDAAGNTAEPLVQTVTLILDAPVVRITEPAENLVTPEATADVRVNVSDPDSGAGIDGADVSLRVDGADPGLVPVDEGGGDFLFEDLPLAENATVEVRAVATFSGEEGASGPRTIRWKSTEPSVSLDFPEDGTVFNRDAEACAGTGQSCRLDAALTTTDAGEGSQAFVDVTCGGGEEETFEASVDPEGTTVVEDVILRHGGACTLTPRVIDEAGQERSGDPVEVVVDRVAPRIVRFVDPSGAQLLHEDDTKVDPGMQHPLRVEIAGVEAGREVTVTLSWTDAETGEDHSKVLTHEVASDVPDDGSYVAIFRDPPGSSTVDYPEGLVSLKAEVSDAAGNSATRSKSVLVESNAPSVRFVFPLALGSGACGPEAPCSSGLCHDALCWRAWNLGDSKQVTLNVSGFVTTTQNLRICSDDAGLSGDHPACAEEGFYEVSRVDASSPGDVSVTVLGLEYGFQILTAEILPMEGGDWVSSLGSTDDFARERRVFVDEEPPTVDALEVLSDTEEPAGFLNIAEQFAPGRTYRILVDPSEAGVIELFANGSSRATKESDGNSTILTAQLDEGSNTIWARVTDLAGNRSPAAAGDTLSVDVIVDTKAPSLAFDNPVESPLIAGDDLDVVLTSDEDGAEVTLLDGGTEIGTETVAGGKATFGHATYGTLADGTHTLTAVAVDQAGNTSSAATDPEEIVVDTVPPSGAIVAPAGGAVLTDAQDADPELGGFQVEVTFTTADDAASWRILVASGCDASFEGCGSPVERASGQVTNPDGQEPAALVSVGISESLSHKRVVLELRDEAGNTFTTHVGVSFDIQDCIVSLVDLQESFWFDASNCPDGEPCDSTTIELVGEFFGPCGGVDELRLLDGGTILSTETDVAGGTATFELVLDDGAELALELEAVAEGVVQASSGVLDRGVDFTPPSVTLAQTILSGFETPPTDAEVTYNAEHDAAPGTAGFQGHLRVVINDANTVGGRLVSVTATTDGSTVELTPSNTTLPSALNDAAPVERNLRNLTYPDLATSLIVVTAEDAAGNSSTASFTATVDTVAPDAIVLEALTDDDVDGRLPAVTLRWAAVGDDGGAGDPASSYDVRYSRSPIDTADAFEAACSASDLVHTEELPAPAAPGAAETFTVSGPDPRPLDEDCAFVPDGDGTWYFAVRATDDVGNVSPLGAESVLSTDAIRFQFSEIRFSDAFMSAAGFGSFARDFLTFDVAVVGDVDGSGAHAVTAGSGIFSDAFCLVHPDRVEGDLVIDDVTGPAHACALGAESVTGLAGSKNLGSFIDVLGDINGDGIDDFGVSGLLEDNQGFVAIYLGQQDVGPDLANPNILVVGADPTTAGYFGFCGPGNFDGDETEAGAPIDDVVIGEPGSDRAHVLLGDPTWSPTGTSLVIDMDDPTDVADSFALHFEADYPESAGFGFRCQGAGDVLPTPGGGVATDDLLIHQSAATDSTIFVIPGRPIDTFGETRTVSFSPAQPPVGEDALIVRLRQDSDAIAPGFGSTFLGDMDLTGDGIPDVLVAQSGREDGKGIYVFDGSAFPGAAGGGNLRVGGQTPKVGRAWIGANGFVLDSDPAGQFRALAALGDYDAWNFAGVGTPDVAYVRGDGTPGSTVEMRMNHETDAGPEILGLFPFRYALATSPYGSGNFSLGPTMVGGRDVTGDARLDIVVGTGQGRIVLIR